MKTRVFIICIASFAVVPDAVYCYGIATHKDLTGAALKASALGTSDLLARIGALRVFQLFRWLSAARVALLIA